jgi:hypothetical protein
LRAAFALQDGDAANAIEELQIWRDFTRVFAPAEYIFG